MSDKPYYVYIVECARGAYYTGISVDVEARVVTHNRGKGAKATKMLGLPVKLVHTRGPYTMGDAMRIERYIKSLSRKAKEKIVRENKLSL